MNGKQLQTALDKLELNQSSFARLINVTPRGVRWWIANERPIPTSIAMLLHLMLDTGNGPDTLRVK